MRKKIVAGNWKMNNDASETIKLIEALKASTAHINLENTRIITAPSFVHLSAAVEAAKGSNIEVAAQNMHQAKSGAYTGEISASMLKSIGIKTVIIGHSERRAYFNEDDNILAEKIDAVLSNDMEAIFCFGEELEVRQKEDHLLEVASQLRNSLFHLKPEAFKNIILAYEPVWAIGTGETATPEQAQEIHDFVRNIIGKKFGEDVAASLSILYGGSVKPANAEEIFSQPDVDGGLIGGASLNADDFTEIIRSI